MKRIGVILLAIVLGLVLCVGCGSNNTASTSDGTQQKASEKVNADTNSNLEESLAVDVSSLKSNDGQPLLLPLEQKKIPERPSDPNALDETESLHWYDMEYAGFNLKKTNLPKSPADGAKGKKIIMINTAEHPYWTAVGIGAKKVADAYGMDFKLWCPNTDLNQQNQLVDKAIIEKPDMVLFAAIDSKAAVQQLRKLNQANVPVIAFNMLPDAEAMQYALAWTGPDDWGQFRMLAQSLADKMGKKGGVCYLTHVPGGSPYFARMYAPITELKEYAPEIETLDYQSPGFDAAKDKEAVAAWITRFGDKLNGIVCADDSSQAIGAIDACKDAGREDILIVAAGNSKVGMDAVKAGDVYAVTYQSAEADGATPVKLAADWFNGKNIGDVAYLTKHIITKDDVDKYMPAQW